MANFLEQAISAGDGDRAAKIIEDAAVPRSHRVFCMREAKGQATVDGFPLLKLADFPPRRSSAKSRSVKDFSAQIPGNQFA